MNPNEEAPLKIQFQINGYLAIPDLLTREEVEAARSALSDLIDSHAFREGRAEYRPGAREGRGHPAGFASCHSRLAIELEKGFEADPERRHEIEGKVRKLMWFDREDPRLEAIAHGHPRIQPILEALLGPDPVLFQSMALIKPARIGREKPWHQDNAYFSVAPLESVIGVWLALDHADIENGCMHVLPGGHREGAFRHHLRSDCEIDPGDLPTDAAVPIELEAGGALFFYGMLPHFTPANRSAHRRRAIQYHYHAADAAALPTEAYDSLFADPSGSPASCAAARKQGI